jgi:hypothetical protein
MKHDHFGKPVSTFPYHALRRASVGVPISLKIRNQRRAEMTRGLFARINRHVAAKHIERFLRDPERAPIAGSADDAGTRKTVHDAL